MKGKDFLSIKDFSPSEILYLLILARQVKTHPNEDRFDRRWRQLAHPRR